MRALCVLVALVAVVGCGSDCNNGEAYCDGNHLVECMPSNDNVYTFHDDGPCQDSMCVEATFEDQEVATCSTTGEIDPRCTGGATVGYRICGDTSTVLFCEYGYSIVVQTCTAASPCVDSDDDAGC